MVHRILGLLLLVATGLSAQTQSTPMIHSYVEKLGLSALGIQETFYESEDWYAAGNIPLTEAEQIENRVIKAGGKVTLNTNFLKVYITGRWSWYFIKSLNAFEGETSPALTKIHTDYQSKFEPSTEILFLVVDRASDNRIANIQAKAVIKPKPQLKLDLRTTSKLVSGVAMRSDGLFVIPKLQGIPRSIQVIYMGASYKGTFLPRDPTTGESNFDFIKIAGEVLPLPASISPLQPSATYKLMGVTLTANKELTALSSKSLPATSPTHLPVSIDTPVLPIFSKAGHFIGFNTESAVTLLVNETNKHTLSLIDPVKNDTVYTDPEVNNSLALVIAN